MISKNFMQNTFKIKRSYSLVVKRVPHELESVVDPTKTNLYKLDKLLRPMVGLSIFSRRTWVDSHREHFFLSDSGVAQLVERSVWVREVAGQVLCPESRIT